MIEPYYKDDLITLYNAKCEDVLPQFQDKSVGVVITDPPYGVGYKYDVHDDSFANWIALTVRWLPQALRVATNGVLFTPGGLEQERFLMMNYPPVWRMCWYKGPTPQRSAVGFKHWETVYVYGETKSQCPDYFVARPPGLRDEINHPAPKPLGWASYLVKNFAGEGIVLDPFVGSGTTLLAAKRQGKPAIGIEMSEAYCQLTVDRLSQHELFVNENGHGT